MEECTFFFELVSDPVAVWGETQTELPSVWWINARIDIVGADENHRADYGLYSGSVGNWSEAAVVRITRV